MCVTGRLGEHTEPLSAKKGCVRPFFWSKVALCRSEQSARWILAPTHSSSAGCFKGRTPSVVDFFLSQLFFMLASFCLADESYKGNWGGYVYVACDGREKFELGSLAAGFYQPI